MAKLTDEDKIANKAAQKIRDRAYSQRRNQLSTAVDAARARVEASPEAQACKDSMDASNRCIEERNKADEAIREQIAELQESLKTLAAKYAPILDDLNAARHAAWAVKSTLEKDALADAKADFADVAEVSYVGAWVIPVAVQAAMDNAAANARAAYIAENLPGANGP